MLHLPPELSGRRFGNTKCQIRSEGIQWAAFQYEREKEEIVKTKSREGGARHPCIYVVGLISYVDFAMAYLWNDFIGLHHFARGFMFIPNRAPADVQDLS